MFPVPLPIRLPRHPLHSAVREGLPVLSNPHSHAGSCGASACPVPITEQPENPEPSEETTQPQTRKGLFSRLFSTQEELEEVETPIDLTQLQGLDEAAPESLSEGESEQPEEEPETQVLEPEEELETQVLEPEQPEKETEPDTEQPGTATEPDETDTAEDETDEEGGE